MNTLISDLAMILMVAGITTLIFKKFKQPLVLGYIVAGFLTSPNFTYFPTIANKENVEIWAEIGVIFLMFALGLEFSFHKLKKVGSTAFIAAGVAISGMVVLGYIAGNIMGWNHMDSLFLGGMLSMSSTAIIFKAFEEMGLKEEKFANLVLGALIIEDIAGIVMMVLLSTIATASANVSPWELLEGISKLVFCLVLWFVLGIYLVPTFFKRYKDLFNSETLVIVSVGLCLSMVLVAEHAGFSSALGAFIMGSFISEAPSAEDIEELVKPIKDLFAAVFFVSVGMLVNPVLLWKYILPVIILVFVTIAGQISCGILGMLAAGQTLKNSVRSGFCLCQIGEFSFILASLGSSLNVTSNFLYPIIVAVSVITTFTTPFCIGMSDKAYVIIEKRLPKKLLDVISRNSTDEDTSEDNEWLDFLKSYGMYMLIFSVLLLAIGMGTKMYLLPYLQSNAIPYAHYIAALVALVIMAPILGRLLQNNTRSKELSTLWFKRRANHIPIIALILGKFFLVAIALYFIFHSLAGWHGLVAILAIGATMYIFSKSRWLQSKYLHFESRFIVNLNEKHIHEHADGICRHGELLYEQLQLVSYNILDNSPLIDKSLLELNFRIFYHCDIIRISTDKGSIFMPSGEDRLVKNSRFTVMGLPNDIEILERAIKQENLGLSVRFEQKNLRAYMLDETIPEDYRLFTCALKVSECPVLLEKSIHSTTLREDYDCMIVSVERGGYNITSPDANLVLEKSDLVWVIGQPEQIQKLIIEMTI